MPIIGILDNRTDDVLYYSSTDITHFMELIKHAISFAMNVRDGRLEEISHTPFMQHGSPLESLENHVMLVKTRTFVARKEETILHFCMDYIEHEITKDIARQLLDLFIEKFMERVKVTGKLLDKVKESNQDFLETCDTLFHETMVSLDLMTSHDVDFLMDTGDEAGKKMRLLFSAISVQGLPVVAKFYDNLTDHFRVNVSDSQDITSVLQHLISAQLSTLFYQSLVQGTSCNYMLLKFSDFMTFTERVLTINFFPISKEEGKRIMSLDDFSFIIMSEGDPELVNMFQSSVSPMLSGTGLFKNKFDGNVARYTSLAQLLDQFPKDLRLD